MKEKSRRAREDRKTQRQIRGVFILFAFGIIVFSQSLSTVLEYLMIRFGFAKENNFTFLESALLVGSVSVIIGTLLSWFAGRYVLRPFDELLKGMSALSDGNYEIRLRERRGIYHRAYRAFNNLAGELEKVQILRSDFVNNFSHEFKTPIVSMQGLVSLMKSRRLPEEKQKEYLSIIEEELKRLSMMTTNVLHMTRLDAQNILTDVATYNLSEQLRTCLLMLEKSWEDKSLSLSVSDEEIMLFANEDLMKQVFINLLDNAIKYSPRGGALSVACTKTEKDVMIRIMNEGPEIPAEEREKIFAKFYQSDAVGEKKGNGIGLSVVKRIVELHSGSVCCLREGNFTVFEVSLPKRAR
jgi:signal transduction histidine kinase